MFDFTNVFYNSGKVLNYFFKTWIYFQIIELSPKIANLNKSML